MLQDETARKDYREDILFDSVWLSRADHQNKSLVSQQVTTPEKPVEPFDLISRYFPIIGFTNSENLKSNFSLRLVKRKSPKAPIRLALIPEPNSPYKKDYRAIGLILDAETYLPADFSALTASGETIKIELTDIKKNKPIKPKTFELTVPKDYTVSKNPLK